MSIDEMIAVLLAAKDGKVIERNYKASVGWAPCSDFAELFCHAELRVRPEPMEIWVNAGPLRDDVCLSVTACKRRECCVSNEVIRFREVTE